MPRDIIEIGGYTTHSIGKKLSNFYPRAFVFDGVACASLEGIIQALKCPDESIQIELCKLVGKEAKKAGEAYTARWQETQTLYWKGVAYKRDSSEYILLFMRIYDTVYEQDPTLQEHLLALGDADIRHSIGCPHASRTTLTEEGMMWNLERLRRRAVQERYAALFATLRT